MNPQYRSTSQWYTATPDQAATLLSKVSYLLCTCLLATAGGAYLSRDFPPGSMMLFWLGALGCVIALNFTKRASGISLFLLYGLSVLEGLALGPLLNAYAHIDGGQVVAQAFILTAGTVGGIGTYIWVTNKDFGFLGKFLMWGLIGLIVVGLISMFFGGPFATGQGNALYSIIGAAIFVGFTLYDFSNIKHRFGPDDYVMATVALYLDFLNLFLFLLQILTGNRRR